MSSDQPDQSSAVDEQKAISGTKEIAQETKLQKEQRHAASDFNRTKKGTGQLSMKVKVYSPFRDYYDGQAFSVTAENDTGPFDILPTHHNFISLLNPCNLIIRSVNEQEQTIIISGGIMHVKSDQVIVFLDV